MKNKWIIAFVCSLLLFSLSACNEQAIPVDGTKNVSKMKAEEVYNKAMEVSEQIKSASGKMEMTQDIALGNEDAFMKTKTNMDIQMTMEPLAAYQKESIRIKVEDMPFNVETEMYITEDEIYMFEKEIDSWVKLDSIELNDLLNEQQDPNKQLKLIENYIKDMDFEQTDDVFHLKLTSNDGQFTELIGTIMKDYLPEELMSNFSKEEKEIIENAKINELYYDIVIDKETLHVTTFITDIDMTMEADGEEISIIQHLIFDYTDFNTIDTIEVPQEVIDAAQNLF